MDDAWAKEIGRRIELARRRAKLSRPELANILEVHTNTITGYERGDRAAYKAVGRVAQATNSDLRWLMFGAEYEDPLTDIAAKLNTLLDRLPANGESPDARLPEGLKKAEKEAAAQAAAAAAQSGSSSSERAALGGKPGLQK